MDIIKVIVVVFLMSSILGVHNRGIRYDRILVEFFSIFSQ